MAEYYQFIFGLVDRSIGSGCFTFDVSIGILGKRQLGETALGETVVGHQGLCLSSLPFWDRLRFWGRFVRVNKRARYAHRTFSSWINVLKATDYTVSFTNTTSA